MNKNTAQQFLSSQGTAGRYSHRTIKGFIL